MTKNPFKKLETDKKVPEEIKDKLMDDVASAKTLMDFGDLFFFKFPAVIASLFKTKK